MGSEEGRALIQSISRLFDESEYHSFQHTQRQEHQPDRSGGEIVVPWTGVEDENTRVNEIRNDTRRRNYGELNNNNNNRSNSIAGREGRAGRGRGRGGRKS